MNSFKAYFPLSHIYS